MNSHFLTSRNDQIHAASQPKCLLCNRNGKYIHHNLIDQLYEAPGTWNFKQCSNPHCKLIWLDPMPLPEELGKAYARYYTHEGMTRGSSSGIKRVYHLVKHAYWDVKFGYPSSAPKFIGKFLYFFPRRRSETEKEIRFLRYFSGGLLLDVGCGDGKWLSSMHDLGWEVEGVDFDKTAVRLARERGLNVHCGTLADQHYADAKFDAVTLNNVIEHVPNPAGLLQDCRRVLKPGGRLVLLTPNSASLGHRFFKESWRGLEPPRHLFLFSPCSISTLLKSAGFSDFSIRTLNSPYILRYSFVIWSERFRSKYGYFSKLGVPMLIKLFTLLEQVAFFVNPGVGENLFVEAVKSPLPSA